MKRSNKGFTLVELIIVIAILAIIMLIAIPNFSGIQQRMQVRADKATAAQIGKAVRVWFTDYTTDEGAFTADGDDTLKPSELAIVKASGDTYSVGSGADATGATKDYDALCDIEKFISKSQFPSSLKKDTKTETNQRYSIFLTAAHNNANAKIGVMITSATPEAGKASTVESFTNLKGITSAASVATVKAEYDGNAPGVAYIEP